MPATSHDITPVYRGEDVALNFTMSPLTDITGWTISFRLCGPLADAAVLYTVVATHTSDAAGTFAVALTAVQTATLTGGVYRYDVWRTDSGSAAVLAYGKMIVKGTVRVP